MKHKWPLMRDIITESDKKALIKHIESSNWLTSGPKVKEFEKAWSTWIGCEHSLMVSSGSTANFLIVAAVKELFNIPDKAKAIVASTTWVTNVGPIMQLGLEPVFCDIDLDTLSLSIKTIRSALRKDDEIKLVFVTHLLGFACDFAELKKEFPDIIFIEDVCESHGASIRGKKCGTLSTAGSFSFYYGHHMTTVEGGMVCTNNSDLADLMRAKRSHGFLRETVEIDKRKYMLENEGLDPNFTFITDGYNFRSTDLNAVLGLSQLKNLDATIAKRQENFNIFLDILSQYDHFHVNFKVSGNSNFSLPFICKNRLLKKDLESFLNNLGYETRGIISGNLTRQPFLRQLQLDAKKYENSEFIHNNGFYIGNNHLLLKSDFELLRKDLKSFFE